MLRLREITTEQVLTPRTVVHMLDQTLTVSEALDDSQTLLGREIVDESDTVEDMQKLARDKYHERLHGDKSKSPPLDSAGET